jgi:amino acid transporter
MIWLLAWLNVRGARAVGASSVWFGAFILAPFAVMSLLGLLRLLQAPVAVWQPLVPPDTGLLGAFGLGLFIVMWNYAGWDAVSTVNGEVENPRRNVPLAIAVTIPLIVLTYFLPVLAGLTGPLPWTEWTAGAFPIVATALGGAWLGAWLAAGALVSRFGLFNAQLLSISRLPFVLAEDGYLPRAITREHARYHTPWVSIVLCGVIYTFFSLNAFAFLVVTSMVLYSAALILEGLALIGLRLKEPHLPRPVRVPGGLVGAGLVTLLPISVLLVAIVATAQDVGAQMLYLSFIALATGPLAYPLLRALNKHSAPAAPAHIKEA